MTWETLKDSLTDALSDYTECTGKIQNIEELPETADKRYIIEVLNIDDESITSSGLVGTLRVRVSVLFRNDTWTQYHENVQSFSDLATTIHGLDEMLNWSANPELKKIGSCKQKAIYEFYYGIRAS